VVEFQNNVHLIGGPLFSPNMGYPILRGIEESIQEPSVRSNRQPPTQPTEFSDLQLNETNYSKQSVVAPTDNPLAFPHEPKPPTSATTTA
jgi:hypothetical protein